MKAALIAIVWCFLLAGRAAAGDWAVASDGCKVWNPNPVAGEKARWTGACKNGFVEGMGVLEWHRNGKPYERDEGQWREGRQIEGGAQTWPGGLYNGHFADSLPNGRGVLIVNGARYDGEFLNGKPNGRGVLSDASGVYDGAWRDGCFSDGKRRAAFGASLQSCP
jgi:hypothetical protein